MRAPDPGSLSDLLAAFCQENPALLGILCAALLLWAILSLPRP